MRPHLPTKITFAKAFMVALCAVSAAGCQLSDTQQPPASAPVVQQSCDIRPNPLQAPDALTPVTGFDAAVEAVREAAAANCTFGTTYGFDLTYAVHSHTDPAAGIGTIRLAGNWSPAAQPSEQLVVSFMDIHITPGTLLGEEDHRSLARAMQKGMSNREGSVVLTYPEYGVHLRVENNTRGERDFGAENGGYGINFYRYTHFPDDINIPLTQGTSLTDIVAGYHRADTDFARSLGVDFNVRQDSSWELLTNSCQAGRYDVIAQSKGSNPPSLTEQGNAIVIARRGHGVCVANPLVR